MDPKKNLSEIVSKGLNRNVPSSFTDTLLRLYHLNTSKDQFSDAVGALGISADLAQTVYVFINDNIDALEKGAVLSFSKLPRPRAPEKRPRRRLLTLDFEEEPIIPSTSLKKTVEDVFADEKRLAKKIVFKKIKKATTQRIKAPARDSDAPDSPQEPVAPSAERTTYTESKSNLIAVEEPKNAGTDLQNASIEGLESDSDDIDNDRMWYTNEEFSAAMVNQYSDSVSINALRAPRNRASSNKSGGGFDSTGAYVDYDHQSTYSQPRIAIVPHFIVPTFLRGSEEYLKLQLDLNRTGRSLGHIVDPIKDPESELARAARNGSFAVKEWKQKQERAQQAKERIGAEINTDAQKTSESNQEPEEDVAYSFDEIQRQRRSLPAYKVKEELLQVIGENQVVVVIGETGSGKTTQLTQFLVESGYSRTSGGAQRVVACTQPRRVAAMSVAKRVAEEMGVKLGHEVGYTIRFEDKTTPSKTVVKYMTEGILLREILEDPNLDKYSCIIIDEAHERSLNTEVLLGLFKQLVRRRRDLKLIITSASMNADRFTEFFGNAPQFFIVGRTFPVEVFYSKISSVDYVETAVKQVVTIHLANAKSDGDILVFMTGQEDIEATCELIKEKLALLENPPPLDVYPIYSTLPGDVQKRIFRRQNAERRKVVVATNIAETSLTVDGIRYVVDCGLVKLKLFNPKLGMDVLQVVPISLANAQQRSGRAGRTAAGVAYRLYTERAAGIQEMYVQPIPEIQRANLSSVMLLLKSLKVVNVLKFPFLDPPPPDLLYCSLYELWAMGAISHQGQLTKMGAQMSLFPMEPTLAKLILLSSQKEFACSAEIITIVAMLSVPNIFYRPKERADEADLARQRFFIAELDHLTLLNVYTQWEQRASTLRRQQLTEWCKKNFVQHRSLLRAHEIRSQLLAVMKKHGFPVVRANDDADIRRCICAAYFHQLARLARMGGQGRGQAEYTNLRQPYLKMYLHPTSALIGGRDLSPQFVVYDELFLSKKEYMQCATAVEPEWLLQYGQVFFGVSALARKELERTLPFEILDKADWERAMVQEETAASVPQAKDRQVRSFKAF